jgi:hypothetical protein
MLIAVTPRTSFLRALTLACVSALGACGNYSLPVEAPPGGTSGGPRAVTTCDELFSQRVQPRMEFCRNCHVPGGVADVADGRLFMLSSNETQDFANLRVAWENLGRNDNGGSRILKMPSGTDTRSHSGGTPWPVGSDAYREMEAQLLGFVDPQACVLSGLGGVTSELPLLGGPRGGNRWSNYCVGKPDSAALPADPRNLLVPGFNEGKAVAFNADWRECPNAVAKPQTCGEMRAQAELGELVGEGQGKVGSPTTFAGGNPDPDGLEADKYNNLWQAWGLPSRPDNFDELVAERHGSPPSVGRNPYPLPGEDPNQTDGGSGQLPLVYTQIRLPDGTWTGKVGQKVCVFCHNGRLGTEADGPGMGTQLGGAGSIGDFTVAGYDFGKAEGLENTSPVSAITISTNRGTGAIDFFQLAFVLFSRGDPQLLLNDKIVLSQAIGNIKSPPWWNLAYRPQKFHGAILPTDSSRIDLAAYYDLAKGLSGGDPIAWVDQHAGPFQVWAESLPSPQFPRAINTPLAEQGAVLFHAKDLWAPNLNNPVPRPAQGNGSCAGCHGAYSPRYVNDPTYLDSPDAAGIAAYTVPQSVIGTDPVYAEAMQSLKNSDGSVSPAIMNNDLLYCGLGNAGTRDKTPIMLAPPLWGVWAAGPYLHNGSVPNIWGVLDPASERPRIWRRVSAPARADQEAQVVMGYDTSLQRAFDFDRLGWKYEELPCGVVGTQPYLACDPTNPNGPSPVQQLLSVIYTNIGFTWNLPRPEALTMTLQDVENRKIFNTHLYSQGNQGHAFTSVLNDQERRALIEYLKTL